MGLGQRFGRRGVGWEAVQTADWFIAQRETESKLKTHTNKVCKYKLKRKKRSVNQIRQNTHTWPLGARPDT